MNVQNVVGIGAGIVDGLGYGDNTKAAVIRLGLMEMIKFCEIFTTGEEASFISSWHPSLHMHKYAFIT